MTVEVTDVNDCPPRFAAASHDVTLLLPTARGVAVVALPAGDPDLPPGGAIKYDIIEVGTSVPDPPLVTFVSQYCLRLFLQKNVHGSVFRETRRAHSA